MIIEFLAYIVIFVLILQVISIFFYAKRRLRKLFKRINYMNDSRYMDDEEIQDIENWV